MRRVRVRPLGCRVFLWTCLLTVVLAAPAAAQMPPPLLPLPPPPPPPTPMQRPVWSGSVGAGVAVTSGNSDSTNYNISFKGIFDPPNAHLLLADALYLRGTNQGVSTINHATVNMREEYTFVDRAITFAQVRYLHDTFKNIEYLVAPSVGIGYQPVRTPRADFKIDAGLGAVWERDTAQETKFSGTLTVNQAMWYKLSSVAMITESVNGLWKTTNYRDALYTAGVGVSAAITRRCQIRIELLDTYKTLPPLPTIKQQDLTIVTSLVYAFQ